MLGKFSFLPPQGRWRKLYINIASLFSVQVANYILPLLTVPYVSRMIGPERIGLLNFSMSYNHYFVLLINFGFDLSAVRLVAARREDKNYINKLFSEVMTAKFLLLAIAAIIFSIVTLNNNTLRQNLQLHIYTCLYCVGSALFPVWLFQGKEDLEKIASLNLLSKAAITLGIVILIKRPGDYIYQNLAMSLVHIFISVVAIMIAIQKYNLIYKIPEWKHLYLRLKESTNLFMSSVAITIYSSSNILMLGMFSTAYAVGIFSAASRLEALIRIVINMVLNQALFPIVANAFGQTKDNGLRIVKQIIPLIVFITIGLGLFIITLSPIMINFLYGYKFRDAIPVLRILSVLPLLLSINSLMGMHVMINLKMDKEYFWITSIVALIGLCTNYFCIKAYGHTGAAWTWVAMESILVVIFYFFLRVRGISIIDVNILKHKLYLFFFKSTQ